MGGIGETTRGDTLGRFYATLGFIARAPSIARLNWCPARSQSSFARQNRTCAHSMRSLRRTFARALKVRADSQEKIALARDACEPLNASRALSGQDSSTDSFTVSEWWYLGLELHVAEQS